MGIRQLLFFNGDQRARGEGGAAHIPGRAQGEEEAPLEILTELGVPWDFKLGFYAIGRVEEEVLRFVEADSPGDDRAYLVAVAIVAGTDAHVVNGDFQHGLRRGERCPLGPIFQDPRVTRLG